MELKLNKIIKTTFIIASIGLISSCAKEDNSGGNNNSGNNNTGNTATGTFVAKVDGTDWKASSPQARIEGGRIAISGTGADGSQIVFSLDGETAKSYELKVGSVSSGVFMLSGDPTSYLSNLDATVGGNINVASIDETNKTMSGTFSFKAKHTLNGKVVNITDGSFNNLKYVTSGGGSTTNTMTVKIDGASWQPSIIAGNVAFGRLSIVGTAGTKTVSVSMPESVSAGTYNIGGIIDDYRGQYNIDMRTSLISTTGSLEIVSHDLTNKKIVGKFSFECKEFSGTQTASITEGNFTINY